MNSPMRMFETDDLDESYDSDKLTLMQKSRVVEIIFERRRKLVNNMIEGPFRTIILAEINLLEREHKNDIIFALKGILTFKQVKDLYVSFFRKCLTLLRFFQDLKVMEP